MKNKILTIILSSIALYLSAQDTKNALFLGNSYTYVNDLPTLIENLATANGDAFNHDQNTPGGYTLEGHSTNTTSLNKIASNNWDFVILQEQSQRPSFPPSQVATEVKPFAKILIDSIYSNNSCTKPLFFMTWGRKNGDASNCASYPPICTYAGMQQRLRETYLEMTQENDADCSPVGMAWKKVRELYPNIELYSPDESHPSINGSYLAACVFYSSMYYKTTIGNTYWSSLDSLTAYRLQEVASNTVLDSLDVWSIETVATNFNEIDSAIFTCDSTQINGIWYNNDTIFSDTINTIGSCADIINYNIEIGNEIIDTTIIACQSIELNGNTYTSDTSFLDTISNSPCNIVYNYNIQIDTSSNVQINSFTQVFPVKTTSYGIWFYFEVQNYDTLTIYNNDTIIYQTTEQNSFNDYIYYCTSDLDELEFILEAKNTCSIDSFTQTFFCSSLDPIKEVDKNSWTINPNPTNNYINIRNDLGNKFSINITDISGKTMLISKTTTSNSLKLNISNFEKGIYFLLIYDLNGNAIGHKKIIKN